MNLLLLRVNNAYIGAQIDLYYWALLHDQWWLVAVAVKWMSLHHNRGMEVPSFHAIESMFRSAYQPIEGK